MPVIGRRGLGIYVQLSSKEQEKRAGQLKKVGEDISHRHNNQQQKDIKKKTKKT